MVYSIVIRISASCCFAFMYDEVCYMLHHPCRCLPLQVMLPQPQCQQDALTQFSQSEPHKKFFWLFFNSKTS